MYVVLSLSVWRGICVGANGAQLDIQEAIRLHEVGGEFFSPAVFGDERY